MDITTFVISVFCFVDDFLKDKRLRQHEPYVCDLLLPAT